MKLDKDQISAFLAEHGRSVGIVLICVPADGVELTDLDQETRDRLVASTTAQVVKIVSENLGVISEAGMCAARERAHAMWQKLTSPRLVGADGPLIYSIADGRWPSPVGDGMRPSPQWLLCEFRASMRPSPVGDGMRDS